MIEQSVTGRTKDGAAFPLTIQFTGISCDPAQLSHELTDELELSEKGKEADAANNDFTLRSATHVHCKVIVYASLSGIVSFFADGRIHGCNHHFSVMLFGYSQQELVDKVCCCQSIDKNTYIVQYEVILYLW